MKKISKKVICINKGSYHLTPGKEYILFRTDDSMSMIFDFMVINDKGIKHYVEEDLFSVELRRDKIIDNLLYESNTNC